jgi:hypothetical protein
MRRSLERDRKKHVRYERQLKKWAKRVALANRKHSKRQK